MNNITIIYDTLLKIDLLIKINSRVEYKEYNFEGCIMDEIIQTKEKGTICRRAFKMAHLLNKH